VQIRPEGREQILERRQRQLAALDRVGERDEDRVRSLAVEAAVELLLP
jgi:hypothetical protein